MSEVLSEINWSALIADGYGFPIKLNVFWLIVDVYDYEANSNEVKQEFGINLINEIKNKYDGILLAVAHNKFSMINIESLKQDSQSVVYDLKGFLPRNQVNCRL